jgi:hypothetical protein
MIAISAGELDKAGLGRLLSDLSAATVQGDPDAGS